MRRLVPFFLVSIAFAQVPRGIVRPTLRIPTQGVDLTLSDQYLFCLILENANSVSQQPSTLSLTILPPHGVTILDIQGIALEATKKSVQWFNTSGRLIIAGLNANRLQNGILVYIKSQVSTDYKGGSFILSDISASSPEADPLRIYGGSNKESTRSPSK